MWVLDLMKCPAISCPYTTQEIEKRKKISAKIRTKCFKPYT